MSTPTFDAVGSTASLYANAASASPATGTHTTGAGTNTGLLIHVFTSNAGAVPTTWTCTVDGASAARIGTTTGGGRPSATFLFLGQASGTNAISVSHDSAGLPIIINTVSVTDLDQTTGFRTWVAGTSGTGSNPTVVVTSDPADLCIDFCCSLAFISAKNQTTTQLAKDTSITPHLAVGTSAGASSVTMGWTVSASGDTNYDIGVSLIGAASGGGSGGGNAVDDGALLYLTPSMPTPSVVSVWG